MNRVRLIKIRSISSQKLLRITLLPLNNFFFRLLLNAMYLLFVYYSKAGLKSIEFNLVFFFFAPLKFYN